MPLEEHSFKLGVVVSLQIRLFNEAFERSRSVVASVGPGDLTPSQPSLWEEGAPGDPSYRRIWTLAKPAKGASPIALGLHEGFAKTGSETKMDGFELPPLPDAADPVDRGATVGDGTQSPAIVGAPGDEHVIFLDVVPTKVRWRNNAHRVPDELEVEMPLSAFPLPPDGSLVRSILVEMRRTLIDADGSPTTSSSDDPDFAGFAKKHGIRVGSGSMSHVMLPCQDFAGVAADTQCRGRMIEADLPVDEAVARFLTMFPAFVGMEVVWRAGAVPPTLGNFAPKAKTPKKTTKGVVRPPKAAKTSVLEAISDYCTLAAVTPTWIGYRLELGPARTINRDDADRVPRMLMGENLLELELDHKLVGSHTRAVEVHASNPDTGQMVIGRYPDDPKLFGEVAPGGSDHTAPTGPLEVPPGAASIEEKSPTIMTVHGVVDPKQLSKIAENAFNEMARQDLTGRMKTRDIATIEGRAKGVADLLELRAGDPISVQIAPSVEAANGSFIQRLATLARDEALEILVGELGYVPAVATRIVDGILTANRPFTYRVREIDFTWGAEVATEFEIGVINYIESLEEQVPARKGGARKKLALAGGGSFIEKWQAIESDMLAGELTPEDATRLMKDVGEAERRARGVTVGSSAKSPMSPAAGSATVKTPGTKPKGFSFAFKF